MIPQLTVHDQTKITDSLCDWLDAWYYDYVRFAVSANHFLENGDESIRPPFGFYADKWKSVEKELINVRDFILEHEITGGVFELSRDSQESFFFARIDRIIGQLNQYDGKVVRGCLRLLLKAYPDEKETIIVLTEIYLRFIEIKETLIVISNKSLIVKSNPQLFPNITIGISDIQLLSISTVQESGPTEPSVKLQWKGDKTDLAELVWALSKSGRITDTSTGQPATQKELINKIVNLFGLDSLDVVNLMKGRYGSKGKPTTFKVQDGKTFVNALQTLLADRVID